MLHQHGMPVFNAVPGYRVLLPICIPYSNYMYSKLYPWQYIFGKWEILGCWKQTEGQTGLVLTVTPAMVYMLDNMLVTPVK